MTRQIDACGLSCPQPVLLTHEAMKAGEREVDVLVDNETSRENVSRAARKQGYNVTVVAMEGDVFRLELRK